MLIKTPRLDHVWESRGIAPHIFNVDIRWMQVFSITFQPLFPHFILDSMLDGTKGLFQEAVVNTVPLNFFRRVAFHRLMERNTMYIHLSSGFRTHDQTLRAEEDSSVRPCVPCGQTDRQI